MRRAKIALLAALVAGLAYAATPSNATRQLTLWYFKGGATVVSPLQVGSASTVETANNKVTKMLAPAATTIDFASTSVGTVLSDAITVTGAVAGDVCEVGTTAAAAALLAQFECQVTAADTVKVKFTPKSESAGACTLGGESPAVCPAQTVIAGSVCTCSNVGTSAAIAALGCAVSVSSTTLTVTSANAANHVVNYRCSAPVDPASGSYYVRVISQQ